MRAESANELLSACFKNIAVGGRKAAGRIKVVADAKTCGAECGRKAAADEMRAPCIIYGAGQINWRGGNQNKKKLHFFAVTDIISVRQVLARKNFRALRYLIYGEKKSCLICNIVVPLAKSGLKNW